MPTITLHDLKGAVLNARVDLDDAEITLHSRSGKQRNRDDGIDTYERNGARRLVHYRDRPCRLNTYGDSFTMCHQVSDGETWQEVLAAHFGEPIRNFGVGGYGVYQAYRRMKRVESTSDGTPYVILNIYDDDHRRNLMSCRWVHTRWFHAAARDGMMFHNAPWVYVRLDLTTGKWIECDNLFPSIEALYRHCDPVFVYETYRRDPVVQLELMREGVEMEDTSELLPLAEFFEVKLDLSTPQSRQQSAAVLFTAYSLRSTMFVVDKVREFCAAHEKKLMVLLSYGSGNVTRALRNKPRFDQTIVEYLKTTGLPVVDSLAKHVEDFKAFRVTPEEYCNRYYIGHYNPTGNVFFAFAIKKALLDWLDPKPLTYSTGDVSVAQFASKLA